MISKDRRVCGIACGVVGRSAIDGTMVEMMKVSMAMMIMQRASGNKTDRRKSSDNLSDAHCKECVEV